MTQIDIVIIQKNGIPITRIQENTLPVFQRLKELDTILNRVQHLATNEYLTYTDSARLSYLAARPNQPEDETVILGPFLTTTLTVDEIAAIMAENSYTISERRQLTQLYQSLPVLAEAKINDLATLMTNLFAHPLNGASEKVKLSNGPQPIASSLATVNSDHRQQIEANYANEDEITNAIASGDQATVQHLNITMTKIFYSFVNRIPGKPLRSSKNICFVFNTICRIAAHKGGVHPVYLNDISEKYALLIERQNTLQGLHVLVHSMTEEYCQLVQSVSTAGYSPMIKRAVDYILLNLGHSMTLNQVSKSIGTNRSYLSRKFKQETGLTITDYINHRRIVLAKQYLSSQQLPITDVAFMTGFNDLNYFIRVFKKLTGQTPLQFRQKPTSSAIKK
ncbi:helix-turn-helix domain-containing protein [Lentilactobacillus parakefiri]|uniref:AraC family transcriptional regulator n=1 Tax=Lentilactobacillus parakefiri TaxID=152332 RepID=A0A224VB42_9LACO|nr:helix-turn-helix domain-containing protein [Lentilactobacillus parakefiri]KRL64303.1 AraC family transcriptional regulator [Lentilactobacillus parakefiri DSM 10551]PAL00893.1 AraC family transcriptional regulator [Lentilactobacillus parakefiri]TDG94645.1 hypothetical protein C5L28_001964 [Lentilactobacillus parakefiri]GAW72085.1 AraC family transcriptional regulator [Lentilactobacillus parakefiri]